MVGAENMTPIEHARSFSRVSLDSISVGTVTDFDLFLPSEPGKEPVLYRHKSLRFTEAARERLLRSHITTLYIDARDDAAYERYLESNIDRILTDETVDTDTKSEIMYKSAQRLVKDVLNDPRAGNAVQRSSEFVEHTTAFMFQEPSALEALMKVTSYDYYTYTHSVNVFVFGSSLAQRMGVDEETIKRYAMGALLHDLGKSRIDSSILNHPGKLDDEQWRIMKMHPAYGHKILVEQGVDDQMVLDVVRHHHEKRNGVGYPDGLRGDGISFFTAVTTIADIFDALTTRRSYKDAMSSFDALRLMKEKMADELAPDLFKQFIVMIGSPSGDG